jgi:hypothetical protein
MRSPLLVVVEPLDVVADGEGIDRQKSKRRAVSRAAASPMRLCRIIRVFTEEFEIAAPLTDVATKRQSRSSGRRTYSKMFSSEA